MFRLKRSLHTDGESEFRVETVFLFFEKEGLAWRVITKLHRIWNENQKRRAGRGSDSIAVKKDIKRNFENVVKL